MRFQTIVAPTITELFERQIQGMILSGQVEPGESVPTERGSCREYAHQQERRARRHQESGADGLSARVAAARGVCCRLGRVRQRGHAHLHIKNTATASSTRRRRRRCCRRAMSLRGSRCGCSCPSARTMILRCCARSSVISGRPRSSRARTWTSSRSWPVRSTGISALRGGNNVVPLIVNGFHDVNIVLWAQWVRSVGPRAAGRCAGGFSLFRYPGGTPRAPSHSSIRYG